MALDQSTPPELTRNVPGFPLQPLERDKSDDLAVIATSIRSHLRRMHEDTIQIGRDLLTAKELLGHGNYLRWLEAEFGWSIRMAQRFTQIAQRLGSKYDDLSHLGMDTLCKLAARSTPDNVIDQIALMARDGRTVPAKVVGHVLRQAKATKMAADSSPLSEAPARLGRSLDARPSDLVATGLFDRDAETKNAKNVPSALVKAKLLDKCPEGATPSSPSRKSAVACKDEEADQQSDPTSGDDDTNCAVRHHGPTNALSPGRSRQQIEDANRRAFERLIRSLKPERLRPVCHALRECGDPVELATMLETFVAVKTGAGS